MAMGLITAACSTAMAQETLPPVADGKAPQTFEEMWAGFDPSAEPLDTEVLKEWEQDGVVLKVLRYRIGIFKGQKAMMAAVYGYPKGGHGLPGLVQIHGGGQYAHWNACFTNAKRGYATISISWGGRIDAPGYRVSPNEVKLFWENKTDDPNYKIITDWGALDAYHHPNRNAGNSNWGDLRPAEWTLDPVESPRNSNWFHCAVAARRALTFLEGQPEVDGNRLGVYGHSMGGKLTVMVAGVDDRVKAAAPSCGGVSDRYKGGALFLATVGDAPSLERIVCPIMFLSPANDFHGRIEDLQSAVKEIRSTDWRVTCAAHHNHQDTAPYEVATQLWMDQHLQGTFAMPRTPRTELTLNGVNGVPSFAVKPDASKPILAVDIYCTQQGQEASHDRFWHHVAPTENGDAWTASVPVLSLDKPLWVYANVLYPLEEPVTGAGYYYGTYTTSEFNLSSVMSTVTPEQLNAAGVKATLTSSLLIEDFEGEWEKEWFSYRKGRGHWERLTRRINDDAYKAPAYSKLAFGVQSDKPGKLVVQVDKLKAEVNLHGGPDWQEVVLFPTDFSGDEGGSRLDWKGIKELRLAVGPGFEPSPKPPFSLRELKWIQGTRKELNARRQVRLLNAPVVDGKTYLDIKHADVLTHGHKAVMDTWLDGKPIVIEGKTCEHGLTTHAPSEAVYFLDGKFRRFHAIAQAWKNATITFEVHIDGKKVFDSGLLKRWQTAPIDLPLQNAQELRLVVTEGGNGKGGDHGSWVDAYLTGEGPE